jgi:energy-converting hydrogenase Eha subunit E
MYSTNLILGLYLKKKEFIMLKRLFALFAFFFLLMVGANAAGIAAPDMSDAVDSVTNVFGAVLGVSVLIFGFKKTKSLL